jgi:hypothetical protein
MIPEEMQRTMQFLLDNQAGHDARLAEIEVKLDNLTGKVDALTANVSILADTQQQMQQGMLTMQREFHQNLGKVLAVSEETSRMVRQVFELEARTIRRVNALEDRVDTLENQDK